MRRMGFIALMFVLALEPLAAQSTDSLNFKGKKALVFSINGFNLSGGLGGKYWITEHQFIRLTGAVLYSTDHSDRPLIDRDDSNEESKRIQYNISFDLATRFKPIDDVVPYVGACIGVYWSSDKYTHTRLSGVDQYSYQSRSLSGGLFLGVEYFITSHIAFSGEQLISVSFSKSGNYRRSFSLRNSSSSLLLSVYL